MANLGGNPLSIDGEFRRYEAVRIAALSCSVLPQAALPTRKVDPYLAVMDLIMALRRGIQR
jgi:hypothetical protein